MNSKKGGEPWSIDGLELESKKIMLVGYDVHHKRGQQSILAFISSVSHTASRYYSQAIHQNENTEICQ